MSNIIEQAKSIAERNRKVRVELSTLRTQFEKLRSLRPATGQVLKPSEIVERWKTIWEVLK